MHFADSIRARVVVRVAACLHHSICSGRTERGRQIERKSKRKSKREKEGQTNRDKGKERVRKIERVGGSA